MSRIKVSDYIFQYLYNCKARNIFLVPGGGNMHLTDSVKKNTKINYTNFFHEQSAVIAAESYSRSNSNLGVALVTSGPGATNAITGVVGAWIESVPLLVISGQVKTSDLKKKKKIRQYGPQEVDIISSVKNFTKYSKQILKPDNIKNNLKKAVYEATCGRNGPVWLDIPLDVQGAYINVNKKDFVPNLKKKDSYKTNIDFVINKIQNSKRPLILAGHGVRLSNSKSIFRKLIMNLKIPVMMTWNSIDLLESNSKLNFGSPGVVAKRYSNIILQKSDLIISIGSSLNQILVAFNQKDFGRNAYKIIVDIDRNQLKYLKIPNSKKINSCSNFFIYELYKQIKKNKIILRTNEWLNSCHEIKKKYLDEKFTKNENKNTLNHYDFTKIISDSFKKKFIISTGSSGLGIEIFYTYFKNKSDQRIFLTSGLGSMGYGLASSIGNCISNKFKRTFLIESDGSFMFNLQELATIQSYKLPIIIILMNNQGYASIRNTHKNYFNKRYVGTGAEDGIFYPSFKNIAKSFKFKYSFANNKSSLLLSLKNNINNKEPTLIEVLLKKNEILLPKVSSILDANGNISSFPMEDMMPLLSLDEIKKVMGDKINPKSIGLRLKAI